MKLRGAIVGDSQLKFLERHRLRLVPSVQVCTFSFPGASTRTLPGYVEQLHLHAEDFIAVYIGGNDLFNGDSADDIATRIKDFIVGLMKSTRHVLVYKIIPRGGLVGAARERERLVLNRLLVQKLAALNVTILTVDHLFLSKGNQVNLCKLAVDLYHVCRVRGIQCLSFVLCKALEKIFGNVRCRACAPFIVFKVHCCSRCKAKGHQVGACVPIAWLQQ
ncbi:uncharacterized protein ISCGN_004006 [Ixodes scapularis]